MNIASDALGGDADNFTTFHDNTQVQLSWEGQEQLKLPFEWDLYSELLRKPHLKIMRYCTSVSDYMLMEEVRDFFKPDNFKPHAIKKKPN